MDAEDLDAKITSHRQDISARLTAMGVLDGLQPDRQDALVDIVVKYAAAYELAQASSGSKKAIKTDLKIGVRQRKKFRTKIAGAIDAVDGGLDYVETVKHGSQPNELFGQTLDALAVPYLKKAQLALRTIPLDWANFHRPRMRRGLEDPKNEARVALMDLFEQIGVGKNAASVRTGTIGNALLGWNVDLQDNHDSAAPNRARAVIKSTARKRQRP